MTWQNVAVIGVIFGSAIALVALNQATFAASLVTAGVGMLGLFTRIGSIADRKNPPAPTAGESDEAN